MDLSELTKLQEAMTGAFEEYKKVNDDRLDKLSKDSQASVSDQEAKLAEIDKKMAELADEAKAAHNAAQKLAAITGSGQKTEDFEKELKSFNKAVYSHARAQGRDAKSVDAEEYRAYKSAFAIYASKGKDELSADERKALNVGSDPQGGYLVTYEMEGMIDRIVTDQSVMRQICRVRQIGQASYKKISKIGGAAAGGWGTETTAPTETGTPEWIEREFFPYTVWAEPRSTTEALEDATIDLEADLSEEVGIALAAMESAAFLTGDGTNKPKGLLTYTMVDEGAGSFDVNDAYKTGKLGMLKTGVAGAWPVSDPSDTIINLIHALKRQYRNGARFLMNDLTLASIRKFKDGNGIYLWNPTGLTQGQIGQLLGYGISTDDYMPDMAANSLSIAFGDFQKAYLILDRRGTVMLRDPYTAKPYVKFWTTRRTGGAVDNHEAVKLLQFAA